jgi:hypothetical protein
VASERSRQEIEALRRAREYLATWRTDDVSDVDVQLEGERPNTLLVVTFTHRDRPGCRFGARFHVLDDMTTPADPEPYVTVVWSSLDEKIEAAGFSLPTDCRAGEVTWLNG